MKRVIRVAGVASSAAALMIGATAAAAAVHKSKPAKPSAVSVKCTTKVGVMVADRRLVV